MCKKAVLLLEDEVIQTVIQSLRDVAFDDMICPRATKKEVTSVHCNHSAVKNS